jgi:glycine cleavage system H lipoate-binding protein
MVVILVLLTILTCIAVDMLIRRGERLRAAQELPGGLFFHSGHTWAKFEPSGAMQVGLDGFAREVLGRVDRFELPAEGVKVRQGEPAFAALQSGRRIEFVSPVDGVVCAVNDRINSDPQGAKEEPYEKGWAVAVRPFNFVRNLKKLRIGAEASEWLEKEVRSFAEFLSLHRAVPQGVGVTLPDGGTHAEGILETMDGEILQIVVRKFFR